jgi:hypothetical protein
MILRELNCYIYIYIYIYIKMMIQHSIREMFQVRIMNPYLL